MHELMVIMTSQWNSLSTPECPCVSSAALASTQILLSTGAQTAPNFCLADFQLIRIIGTGAFADVFLALEQSSGLAVVVKEMHKSHFRSQKSIQRLLNEKELLAGVHHSFIVKSLGTFQDRRSVYLVMEYVPGGELHRLITHRGPFCRSQAQFYATEIASALAFLHSQGIVYRDLKGENVLIADSGHVKLVDFGFARKLKKDERTYSICGTPHSMAPEVISRSGHSFASDWWGLGILLYEMVAGAVPFDGESAYEIYAKIVSQPFSIPKQADNSMANLLEGLLTKDPLQRISGNGVLAHPFFAGVNWGALEQVRPPFVPDVKHQSDDSNFDLYRPASDCEDSSPPCEILFASY